MGFSGRKIPRSSSIRYRRKQSGSVIRTIIRIGLKSYSVRQCPNVCRHVTFHQNPCTIFWVILLTDRQTDKWIRAKTFTSSFVGYKNMTRILMLILWAETVAIIPVLWYGQPCFLDSQLLVCQLTAFCDTGWHCLLSDSFGTRDAGTRYGWNGTRASDATSEPHHFHI